MSGLTLAVQCSGEDKFTQKHNMHSDITHTRTHTKHESRHINLPPLEFTDATVSPQAKTDARY